jgi:hypothetical protein
METKMQFRCLIKLFNFNTFHGQFLGRDCKTSELAPAPVQPDRPHSTSLEVQGALCCTQVIVNNSSLDHHLQSGDQLDQFLDPYVDGVVFLTSVRSEPAVDGIKNLFAHYARVFPAIGKLI